MERSTPGLLRIGDWCVNPTSGHISRNGQSARLDVRTTRLLACLAARPGEVVSIDDLINQAWSGVVVSQDSVYQAVASLRRLLGDDSKRPMYIETVPRLGYRMVATVGPWFDPSAREAASSAVFAEREKPPTLTSRDVIVPIARGGVGFVWIIGAALCLMVVSAFLLAGRIRDNSQSRRPGVPLSLQSIAVLPFQDLTEGMTQAPFADGMTVELIDKLSKIPGLRVHAPMGSSSLKGKRSTIRDMAKMLAVAYVIDGNVRKSGSRLRVVARLIYAEDEHVVWSETYDRPLDDVLSIQEEIAGEVAKALKASI